MALEIDTGFRTSTNAGVAGGLAIVVIFILTLIWPEQMMNSPMGLEAGLTALFMGLVARFSKTPDNPGKL